MPGMRARPKRKDTPFAFSRVDRLIMGEKPEFLVNRRLGGIGDVIMTTPLVKAIRQRYPNCHLTYATDVAYADGALADVLKHNPYIDEIIPSQVADPSSYDVAVDVTDCCIQYERTQGKSHPMNRIDIFASHAGIPLLDKCPTYVVTKEEQEWAKKLVDRVIKEYSLTLKREDMTLIGIVPKSNSMIRDWPEENMRRLTAMLTNNPNFVAFIIGSDKRLDWQLFKTFSLLEYKIRPKVAVMNELDLIVSADTGPIHLAGALHKKIVGLFGPIPAQARINHYEWAVAIEKKNLACKGESGCWYNPSCNRINTYAPCMINISVDEVYRTTMNLLSRTEPIREIYQLPTYPGGLETDVL